MRKLEVLKEGGSKEKRKKKKCFVSWKVYFSSCYLFIIHFALHFKDDFLNLR
jgi:hypothetical protein